MLELVHNLLAYEIALQPARVYCHFDRSCRRAGLQTGIIAGK